MTRHALLCFRGTGGEWGLDYTSRVAQACSALVEEIDVDAPATMGGCARGSCYKPPGAQRIRMRARHGRMGCHMGAEQPHPDL